MKVGSFRTLCAAAVAGAMAVPAMAQNAPTAEGGTRQSPNGARGAEGEASTVRPNVGQAQQDTLRPTAPAAGAIVDEQPGARTANFPPQNDRQQNRQADGQQAQGRLGDAALVRWIGADNEAEIRVSEVAQQKAQNEQVKQFAKMMVDEHTKLGEQLQKASRNQGHSADAAHSTTIQERTTRRNANADENARDVREDARDAAENRNEARDAAARGDREDAAEEIRDANENVNDARNNARNANRTTTRTETQAHVAGGNMRGGNNPAVALHEQIKQECAASFTKELQSKQGAEFDKCYLGQQIMAHMAMIDTLKVADQHASADLKQTLQQAQQSTKQHLQKAKELMKQVENERQ